ncbi:MAG: hypothetical protein JWM85_3491 [Acidimicrobiaceae bacterium]|nr:hypothetical protein [Acidimicrobiaceae bacterium]
MTGPAGQPAVRGQLRRIAILLNEFGIANRDQALGFCSAIAGRPITSRKELTAREASHVLDDLELHLANRDVDQAGRVMAAHVKTGT